jgi:hypothetical protein
MVNLSLGTIAKEALKPASSLIDALVSPMVARLQEWSSERNLHRRMDSSRLERAFEHYMRQIYRRAAGTTTMVFPQRVLPLPAIYEPLKLIDHLRRERVAESELEQDGFRAYIIDHAGMGKSTLSKHLVLRCLRRRERIPLLLELRTIGEGEQLVEALGKQFDTLDQTFDRDVLNRLLEEGKFLIILDGFDEVPEKYRNDVTREIEALAKRAESSSIILTSRPENALPEMPLAQTLTISSLSPKKAANLVFRYDTLGRIDVGKRLVQEFHSVPSRFLRTPLFVGLLYRTFGFNGAISTRVSSFYDEVFNALYKGHDLSKSGFARSKVSSLDYEDFRRLLRGLAFLMLAKQTIGFRSEVEAMRFVADASRLTSVRPASSESYLKDLLKAVPFLIREGIEIRFLHKTFVEYFAAEYITSLDNAADLLGKIRLSSSQPQFVPSFELISDLNPTLYRRVFVAPLAEAVLRHKPTADPLVRTLSFFGEVRFALFMAEPYDHRAPFPRPTDYKHEWYFYDEEHKVRLVIAMKVDSLEVMQASWNLVTEEQETPFEVNHHSDFSSASNLPSQGWVELPDSQASAPDLWPVLEAAIKSILSNPSDLSPRLDSEGGSRLLSNTAAQHVLNLVREEASNREWIVDLLGE